MRRLIIALLLVGSSCGRGSTDDVSGDTCPDSVVCAPKGYDFTFGDPWGTAYTCTVEEGTGAVYVPMALDVPCVTDGDPCGDGTEDCYVPQDCLTNCTLGEVTCSDGYVVYECYDGDWCPDPYWAKAPAGTVCPQ